jgi:peptidyl-tRNA hydrolase
MEGGPTEAALLGGMLNIGTHTLRDQFQRIKLGVCKVEKSLGEEILDQNQKEEMRLTQEDVRKHWQADRSTDSTGRASIMVYGDIPGGMNGLVAGFTILNRVHT